LVAGPIQESGKHSIRRGVMSQSEILNYDPSLRHPDKKTVQLREVLFFDRNKVPITSVYVPVPALANRTNEEVGRYLLRVLQAHSVNIGLQELNYENAEGVIRELANTFAYYYASCMVVNLMAVYAKRLERGDGTDPEITIVDKTEASNQCQETVEREMAAVGRISDHLFTKFETGVVKSLIDRRDMMTELWRLFLRNLVADTIILIGEKRVDAFSLSKEEFLSEFMSISKELWWGIYYQTFEFAGQRIAAKVLQRLNPAGVAFEDLKEMVRGGLNAWPTFQDVGQLAKGLTRSHPKTFFKVMRAQAI
jgi:hypothetical protein